MNNDLTAFIEDVSWFIQENDEIEIETKPFELTADFKTIYPKLTKLIECARKTHMRINDVSHILFAWDNIDGVIYGWLNKLEEMTSFPKQLTQEHQILLQNIGGIQESFNQPEDSLTNNQNFMFIGRECTFGIQDWDEYYKETCKEENLEPIDHKNLICFVEEANGNLTLYNPETNNVILFASDHCFDDIKPLAGQPEYTFYEFDKIGSFKEYAEKVAEEWLERNASC